MAAPMASLKAGGENRRRDSCWRPAAVGENHDREGFATWPDSRVASCRIKEDRPFR